MKEEIKAALEKVRPALQMDGGDVEFVDFTDTARCGSSSGCFAVTWRDRKSNV